MGEAVDRSRTPARMRLVMSAVVGLLVAAILLLFVPWQAAVLLGWDLMAAVFLIWIYVTLLGMSGAATKAHARQEDESKPVTDLVLVSAALVSLVGVALDLVKASQSTGLARALITSVAVASVGLSWAIVHVVYMLKYADAFYADEPGGIDFNDRDQARLPDYHDFAYLAFTIGMTYQVSDTTLRNQDMRRTALRHALLSFVFGTSIIAVTINVVANLLNR
jgi:uncharacterized membrane protein